jgi:hypothetical protein
MSSSTVVRYLASNMVCPIEWCVKVLSLTTDEVNFFPSMGWAKAWSVDFGEKRPVPVKPWVSYPLTVTVCPAVKSL